MAAVMGISLTPELEQFIDSEISGGDYRSASDVVRAGLRRLKEDKERRHSFSVSSLTELEDKLAEGVQQLDQGKSVPGELFFTDLRKRNDARRKAKQ